MTDVPSGVTLWARRVPPALAARAALLAACALLASVLVGPSRAVLPAMVLLVVASLVTLPPPVVIPQWSSPMTEAVFAAVLVVALGEGGQPFLAYLIAPCVAAGLIGLGPGLAVVGAAITTVVVTGIATTPGDAVLSQWLKDSGQWVLILLACALLASWTRRVRPSEAPPRQEAAYRDAHRLLAELHVVARHLSLGLDASTLAQTLLDEVGAAVPEGRSVVLTRTDTGVFVPLAGSEMDLAREDSTVEESWASGEPITTATAQGTFHVAPVGSGARVTALLALRTPHSLATDQLEEVAAAVGRAGPRLAAAMMFDDVRRLATKDERMRLARDIHDGVAQEIASLGYLVDDVRARAEPRTAQELGRLREEIQRVTGELRLSLFDLRSGMDDQVGLGAAISEHAQGVGSKAGLVVHAVVDETPERLPRRTEVELFRIVQEALTNVRKHANASNVWVECRVRPPSALVRVMDDGTWLQPRRADSMGVIGMRERAERIGGALTVGPRLGGGTLVEVRLGEATVVKDSAHSGRAMEAVLDEQR